MLGTVIHSQFCANGSWDSLFPTATANIKALGQLQTYEPRTLFLMTSLQYYCILGLAEIKTLHPRDKKCAKDAGCSLTKSLWVILHAFLSSAVYFSKSPFSKKSSACQIIWILIKTNNLFGLIWVQTVCN